MEFIGIIGAGGGVLVLLCVWYVFRDVGGPNLNSREWYVEHLSSTNEKVGDVRE